MSAADMSNFEVAAALIMHCFDEYAAKDGDPETLTKAELKEFLQKELPQALGKAPDKAAVDKFFSDLDLNKDDRIDFPEFGKFLCTFIGLLRDIIKQQSRN